MGHLRGGVGGLTSARETERNTPATGRGVLRPEVRRWRLPQTSITSATRSLQGRRAPRRARARRRAHDLDDGRRARRRGPARRRGLRRRLRRGRADGRPGALRPSLGCLARGGAARHLPPLPRRRAAHAAAQRRGGPRHCRGGRGGMRPRRLAEVAERRARRRPQARRHPGRRAARAGRPASRSSSASA